MKNTIDFFIDLFTCGKLFTIIPELKAEIYNYRNYIDQAKDEVNLAESDQWFELPITTGIGDDYYFLNWRIPKVLNEDYVRGIMPMDNTSIFSDTKHLIPRKLLVFQNLDIIDPILLIQFFPINKNIVIDGNHRYHAKVIDGSPTINICYLDTDQHIQLLVSERQKALYKIHHNLTFLHNLCLNRIGKNTIKYYTFGNDISFSWLKRLRLQMKYRSNRRYKAMFREKFH